MQRVVRFCFTVALGVALAYTMQQRAPTAKAEAQGAFRADSFVPFRLRESIPISHDSRLFRFDLPTETAVMGLPVASCIATRYKQVDGEYVVRHYTPTTLDDTQGHFDLVVKKYPNAKMGGHLSSLKPGDTLEVKGPILKQQYIANRYQHIGMIAGGTGIAPMYQVIQGILKNPNDKTEVDLIYANKTPGDILLREELDALVQAHRNFRVHYVISQPDRSWSGEQGYVNASMITKYFVGPREDSYVYVCGPPPMMNSISGSKAPDFSQGELKGVLKDCGYTEAMVFKF